MNTKRVHYIYGMRLRGFSPGCQPMKGLIDHEETPFDRYHELLTYDRELTPDELRDYELDLVTWYEV